jgi:hypothetical protein
MAVCAALSGCASPGPPRPPSLRLPLVVTDFRAERIGDSVELEWTTPEKTTDKQAIHGSIGAVVCREQEAPPSGKTPVCDALDRLGVGLGVVPGPSKTRVRLSDADLAGPPRLLGYRVELLNGNGRTAGWSGEAFAASGAVPGPVVGLRVRGVKAGVEIVWEAGEDRVELRRTPVPPAKASAGTQPEPREVRLDAGPSDQGGVLDTGVRMGETYRYAGYRVRSVSVDGHALSMRSADSAPVEYAVRDIFPPRVPTGLAIVPGFPGANTGVDLSWEPVPDADLAGYIVYRRTGEAGAWVRLTPEPVQAAAFRDAAPPDGVCAYRVTAVDATGNESSPSGVAIRTP